MPGRKTSPNASVRDRAAEAPERSGAIATNADLLQFSRGAPSTPPLGFTFPQVTALCRLVYFRRRAKTAANRRLFVERRLCGSKSAFVCGATFARLRNDVCAATNRSLFAERRLRGCGATFARQQIAACSILPMFAPPAWRSFPDTIAHPIGACGVISRKQTRAMRCGRGNPLSDRIAGARTHPRACPAPRLRRRP